MSLSHILEPIFIAFAVLWSVRASLRPLRKLGLKSPGSSVKKGKKEGNMRGSQQTKIGEIDLGLNS